MRMKKIFHFIFAFLTTTLCFGQSDKKTIELNLGFENDLVGGTMPYDWLQWGTGYKFKVDTIVKKSGKRSILIEPKGEKSPNSFGCIAYSIPARYQAKEIELKAHLKFKDVSDGAVGLLLRIDGNSGIILSFENMLGKNIQGTRDWSVFSVKSPFPEGAKTIYIGGLLTGKGQLWVDDFEVFIDGKFIQEVPLVDAEVLKADQDVEFDSDSKIQSIDLSPLKVADLDIMGKVWGFLKYYHPAVAAGKYNWDGELFRILPKVLNAKNPDERNIILNSWVSSFGKVERGEEERAVNIKLLPDLSWINQGTLGVELVQSLNEIKLAKRPSEHYYIGLAPNVGNPVFKNEKPYGTMNFSDTGFRLLSLYRYWNIIQYYFPYKNLIEEDWNNVLRDYIPRFVGASDELEYKLAALSLIARIHDTHANIWGMDNALNNYKGKRYSALNVAFIENSAVVTDYFDPILGKKSGLEIGDVIESIDGKQVSEIVKERLALTPASNYPTQLRDIASSLLRTNKSELEIKYKTGGKSLLSKVETFTPEQINLYAKYQRKDTCFKVINKDIAYLYPGSVKNEYLPRLMEEVEKSKGLIIDFRCYPSDFIVFTLSEYLFADTTSFVKFSNGSISTPGLFTIGKELKVGKANPAHYKGKVVIIINETTQSSAEYHTMAFRKVPKAVVIGSTTAAADGNVSRFSLPGSISTMISGIGVYYPDGSETQRVGIVPDIEVKPTIKGIREGRDELLEKAIQLIR